MSSKRSMDVTQKLIQRESKLKCSVNKHSPFCTLNEPQIFFSSKVLASKLAKIVRPFAVTTNRKDAASF